MTSMKRGKTLSVWAVWWNAVNHYVEKYPSGLPMLFTSRQEAKNVASYYPDAYPVRLTVEPALHRPPRSEYGGKCMSSKTEMCEVCKVREANCFRIKEPRFAVCWGCRDLYDNDGNRKDVHQPSDSCKEKP